MFLFLKPDSFQYGSYSTMPLRLLGETTEEDSLL
jgi:hypothetical protein